MRPSACSAARLATIRSLHQTCSEHRQADSCALNCPDDQQIDEEQPNGEPQHEWLLRSCDEPHRQAEQRHYHDSRPTNCFALPHARVFVRTLTMSEDDICNVCAARLLGRGGCCDAAIVVVLAIQNDRSDRNALVLIGCPRARLGLMSISGPEMVNHSLTPASSALECRCCSATASCASSRICTRFL